MLKARYSSIDAKDGYTFHVRRTYIETYIEFQVNKDLKFIGIIFCTVIPKHFMNDYFAMTIRN